MEDMIRLKSGDMPEEAVIPLVLLFQNQRSDLMLGILVANPKEKCDTGLPLPPGMLGGRFRSLGHAIRGLATLVQTQPNAKWHLVATFLVTISALLLGVARMEACFLVVAIAMVWVAEAFNTALEFLCDRVSTRHHPLIRKSKDIAAGGVLISAVGAACIGFLVLFPYMKAFLSP